MKIDVMDAKNVINEIHGYEDLKIYQNEKCLKYSLDSVLLADFVNIKLTTNFIIINDLVIFGIDNELIIYNLVTNENENIRFHKKITKIDIPNL